MTGWIEHDGRGVPPDAKPGVTICRFYDPEPGVWPDGTWDSDFCEGVWDGEPGFDWGCLDDPAEPGSPFAAITHYRNPSTDAAVEALKALADNPKRKVKEAMR